LRLSETILLERRDEIVFKFTRLSLLLIERDKRGVTLSLLRVEILSGTSDPQDWRGRKEGIMSFPINLCFVYILLYIYIYACVC